MTLQHAVIISLILSEDCGSKISTFILHKIHCAYLYVFCFFLIWYSLLAIQIILCQSDCHIVYRQAGILISSPTNKNPSLYRGWNTHPTNCESRILTPNLFIFILIISLPAYKYPQLRSYGYILALYKN